MTRSYLKQACRNGHNYVEGSYKLSSTGKRICLACLEAGRKTHCPQGHEYTAENVYLVNGTPQCKICRNQRMRDRRPATGIGAGGLNAIKTHCPQGHEYTVENTARSKDGKRRYCRACARSNGTKQNIKRYGITPEQVQEMLEQQDYRCKICRKEFTSTKDRNIDHDHNCCPRNTACAKCVRGILCTDCNHGLGKFHDNVRYLQSAIEYLEKPPVKFEA